MGSKPGPGPSPAPLLWRVYERVRGVRPFLASVEDSAAGRRGRGPDQAWLRLRATLERGAGLEDSPPEWRRVAAVSSESEFWSAWRELPTLSKEDLRTRFHPDALLRQGRRGLISSTGGSTGEPTPYLHDTPMQAAVTAAKWIAWRSFGWYPGLPTVCLWGSERDIGRQARLDRRVLQWIRNETIIGGYGMSLGTIDAVRAAVRRHPRCALYGFTGMLEYLAREQLRAADETLKGRIAAAWNGGEMLFPQQSALFEQATGVPLGNLYGGRECGPMAYRQPGQARFEDLRPLVHLDVVRSSGEPAQPGETGAVAVTSTVCGGTPFIRYLVGDLATVADRPGGAAYPASISEIEGRVGSLIELADGRRIHTMFWNHLLKEYEEVHRFQVADRGAGGLELRLVGPGMTPDREARLVEVLTQMLGSTPFRVAWVDEIALGPQGKLSQYVRL